MPTMKNRKEGEHKFKVYSLGEVLGGEAGPTSAGHPLPVRFLNDAIESGSTSTKSSKSKNPIFKAGIIPKTSKSIGQPGKKR